MDGPASPGQGMEQPLWQVLQSAWPSPASAVCMCADACEWLQWRALACAVSCVTRACAAAHDSCSGTSTQNTITSHERIAGL